MIKSITGYLKANINNTPYLLPFGQQIADHKPGLKINESGVFLWDALCKGTDKEQLLKLLGQKYEATQEELPLLKQDLDEYLMLLFKQGLITIGEQKPHATVSDSFFRIGPLVIAFQGSNDFFHTYFSDFSCEATHADQLITCYYGMPPFHRNGTILVRNKELIICDDGDSYIFLYPDQSSGLYEMHVTKDGANAAIYCSRNHSTEQNEAIFHALRFAFLILAQQHELYAVHSASLLYQGRAWLFSGSSGTGKSTHTNLWHTLFDTPLLNGDLNLLGAENKVPTVYGIPWCGTSGIHTTKNYPLGGICFLKQDTTDHIVHPDMDANILFLFQRMISPAWTAELLQKNIAFSDITAKQVPMFRLFCTKEPSAAVLSRQTIDQFNEKEINEHGTNH